MSMTPTNFTLLTAALRSGRYEQAQHRLRTDIYDEGESVGYCCLGVYCVERGIDLDATAFSPVSEYEKPLAAFGGTDDIDGSPLTEVLYDFTEGQRSELARMNDGGRTFAEIADYLEQHRSEFVSE